jgi:DMSO/TMAO reductase YedYZ molybdopterin-dependent catalytic subunit
MRSATLDRLLAVLVAAMVATGLLTLRTGAPSGSWLFVAHAVLAGALALAITLKLRASVGRAVAGRRWGRLALGLSVSALAIAALIGGYAWVASGRLLEIGPWTVLTLHAWAGLALLPLVIVHLLPRRWRLLRPARTTAAHAATTLMSRRSLVVGGGLAAIGVAAFGLASLAERVAGGTRRFTGSRWLPAGGIPPVTTFFGEGPPPVDPATWQVRVTGRVDLPASYDLASLAALGATNLTAILDCTSGWALETSWHGTPLAAVLDAAGVGAGAVATVEVRSATGWSTSLPLAAARRALLATHVAGTPLAVGNGAPVRLVVPDHRGLDWVKWVTEIRVS